MEWICTKEECISLYAFDYWSTAHFFAGIPLFAITFLICCYFFKSGPFSAKLPFTNQNTQQTIQMHQLDPKWLEYLISMIVVIAGAVLWELFENYTLLSWGWKARRDAPINWSVDIILVTFGGLFTLVLTYLLFNVKKYGLVYAVYGIVYLALWIILFFVLRFMTNLNL
jgi:hypothetical protein